MKDNEIRATGAMLGIKWVIDKCSGLIAKRIFCILFALFLSLLIGLVFGYGLSKLIK